ncbi:MAG: hypothetical protein K2Q10_08690, partial [Rhodospirillales bacterium]|nr:hypothetical protein [Rhodospirillales bacterium]
MTLLLIAGIGLMVGFFMLYAAARQDAIFRDHMTHHLSAELTGAEKELAARALDYAWWDEMARHTAAVDVAWLDKQVGRYVNAIFGVSAVLLLDGEDRPVYVTVESSHREADTRRIVEHGLETLIRRARAKPISLPEPATGIVTIHDVPHLAAVVQVTPFAEPAPPGNRPVLVFATSLPGVV